MNNQQDPIHGISQRVESLENRFDDNINKINHRLDQIVDIMTKVTQLQEREIKNSDHISELKANIREVNDSIKDWNHRIHDRMDRHFGEVQLLEDTIEAKIKVVELQNQTTRDELNKWFNRGVGALAVASMLLVLVQGVSAYVIDGIIENNKSILVKVDRVDSRLHGTEISIAEIRRFAQEKHNAAPVTSNIVP